MKPTIRPQQLFAAVIRNGRGTLSRMSQADGDRSLLSVAQQLTATPGAVDVPQELNLAFECHAIPVRIFDLIVEQVCQGHFPIDLARTAWSIVNTRINSVGPLDLTSYTADFATSVTNELAKLGMLHGSAVEIGEAINAYKNFNRRELETRELSLTPAGMKQASASFAAMSATLDAKASESQRTSNYTQNTRWMAHELRVGQDITGEVVEVSWDAQ